MTRPTLARLTVAAACGLMLLASAAPALAQTATTRPPPAGDVTERALAAIDRRVAALDAATARLPGVEALTDPHERALLADLAAVRASLVELRAAIEAEDDRAELRALVGAIVTDHYVFRFQLPRVHLVVAADRVAAAAQRLEDVAGRLETRIDAARAAGYDVAAAEAALRSLLAHVTAAANTANGTANRVLALEVGGFPANQTVLAAARDELAGARRHLAAAVTDARAVAQALKTLG